MSRKKTAVLGASVLAAGAVVGAPSPASAHQSDPSCHEDDCALVADGHKIIVYCLGNDEGRPMHVQFRWSDGQVHDTPEVDKAGLCGTFDYTNFAGTIVRFQTCHRDGCAESIAA